MESDAGWINESNYEDDYQIILNSSLDSIDYCLNVTGNRACLYSIILVEMTRKTTLWINFILIIVGLFVNLLVILVFSRSELRKMSIAIHTLGLAVSDICLLSCPVFLKWLNEYKPDFFLFHTNFWCKTHGYFDIVFCCWSAWNVVALSNERWMTICRPSKVNIQNPKKRALTMVCGMPIVSLLMFIWYPFVIQTNDASNSNLSLNSIFGHSLCQPKNNSLLLLFGSAGIILTYLIPFVMITFYNSRIVKTLSERIAKRKEYFGNSIYSCEKGSISTTKFNFDKRSSIHLSKKSSLSDNECDNRLFLSNSRKSSRRYSADFIQMSVRELIIESSEVSQARSPDFIRSSKENLNQTRNYLFDKRYSGCKTEILRARERINQNQRVKNDRSISIMLITVSVTFLILTFPYQFVWVADQLYRVIINHKFSNLPKSEYSNFKMILFKDVWVYQLVSFSVKDIALTIRNLNFSINFFLYSTMSNLFRKELNVLFQNLGFYNFILFKNTISSVNNPKYDKLAQKVTLHNRSAAPSGIYTNNFTTEIKSSVLK